MLTMKGSQVEVAKLIKTLGELEAKGVINPNEVISMYGLEKVSQAVESYLVGLSYGIPEDVCLSVLEKIKQKDTGNYHFLGDEEMHDLLLRYSRVAFGQEGVLDLNVRDICKLACVESNQTTTSEIAKHLEQNGYVSTSVTDPTKFTRTRIKQFRIDLNDLPDLSDLWAYLGGFKDQASLPIKISDFLDGTEDNYNLRLRNDDFALVVPKDCLLHFRSYLYDFIEAVYEEDSSSSYMYLENTGFNRFLLSQVLCKAFPRVSLRQLVSKSDKVDSTKVSEVVVFLRERLKATKVNQGIFNAKWNLLDTSISGYVYLLSYMYLEYYLEEQTI